MLKRTLTIIVILSLIVLMSVTSSNAIKKEESEWKNLKILSKDISDEALDSIMDHFSVSLGVKCSFCHLRNDETRKIDFASDAKEEKEIAREMMRMTASINSTFLNRHNSNRTDTINEVVCFTCHRGIAYPYAKDFIQFVDSTVKAKHK